MQQQMHEEELGLSVTQKKKSVNFAGRDEASVRDGSVVRRSSASNVSAASFRQRQGERGSTSLSSIQDGVGHNNQSASHASKHAARHRRKMWRRFLQHISPAYWMHLLDKNLPIIHPDSATRVAWDFFMLALVIYVCFMEPFTIGFGFERLNLTVLVRDPTIPILILIPPTPPLPPSLPPAPVDSFDEAVIKAERAMKALEIVTWMTDSLFWMDLLSNFRTAYVDQTATLIRHGPTIAKHYLSTWFIIDLCACIPFDSLIILFVHDLSANQLTALMLLRTLRLLRLARLLRVVERMRKGNFVRLLKLLFFILLVVHWLTCLWFFMYRLLRESLGLPWTFDLQLGQNPAIMTYFLQGYLNTFVLMIGNDIAPGNDVEKLYACFVLGMGACFYAIIMGNISLLVNNLDPTASRHRLKRDIVNNTIRYLGIKGKVVKRIAQYFDYLLTRNHPGPDGMLAVSQLPSSMFRDIACYMYEDHVKKVPLFHDCEDAFIRHLVMRLKLQVYLQGEVVFKMGDVGHEMFFITKGHVAVLNTYQELLAILPKGGFFGELGLLATAHRTAHCVSLSDCDLNLLVANDLMTAMNSFPDSAKIVRERAIKRLNELQLAGKADLKADGAPGMMKQFKISVPETPEDTRMRKMSAGPGADLAGSPLALFSAALPENARPKERSADQQPQLLDEGIDKQQDTITLLEKLTLTMSQLTVRLEAVYSDIYDINGRLVKVDAAPVPGAEFGPSADAHQLDMGLDLEGY